MQIGSAKRAHSVPAEYPEESMPDHEPPSPPPLPPPHEAPPPSASTVAIVARHMSTAKKSRKKVFLTPDEAMDRLLAEHDRKKAKAAKRTVVAQDRERIFAIGDQDAPEEVETQTMVPVAKKSKAPKTIPVKMSVKTKKSTAGASGSQRRKKYA